MYPGEESGNPLQYSCLGKPMDRGTWWATVCGVPESQTELSICCYSYYYTCVHSPPNPPFIQAAIWHWLEFPVLDLVFVLQLPWFFLTLWTATCQAPRSFTVSWSLLKLMSFESLKLSNHLILSPPSSPFAFNLSQHQGGLFQWIGSSH